MHTPDPLHDLTHALSTVPELAFAVLVGSRAKDLAKNESDWDVAVLWKPGPVPLALTPSSVSDDLGCKIGRLGRHEALRRHLAKALHVSDTEIDLIDLSSAGLAMKAAVVEEGKELLIPDELEWARFQSRVWRELEDFYWERTHAA